MSCRLSDLITEVRACKTAEAERARITDECAQIRNALREEAGGKRRGRVGATPFRERNMLKLMFAHMMGHSTHWAQMECVKMSASPSFHEKRVGYLGLMLLLDESASVLTLVTHQLSRDLQDESPFVNSLALATLANIASADMARDLHRHVERHLASGPPLTRKKAALTCIRLFKVRPPARACCGRSTPLSPFKEARARAVAGREVAAGRREQAALALGEWGGQCGRRREAATCAHLSAALARCERLRLSAPELIDDFIPRVVGLLTDRTHATIMTGTTLMWHMARMKPAVIPRFSKAVPHLAKLLRKLVVSTNVPNYTIGRVCDPFLQSRLLSLLRVLGRDNSVASEQMNDVLAQVATHTDASRVAGNAILYDAVQCILEIESEEGLRILAINILGRFLLNKENNIRYVALNTLCHIVDKDLPAVARHRTTIVACLRDADSSIRRRALDLVYALTDSTNILSMAGEMVNYAVIAEKDERAAVCARVASAARRFAPSMRWEADTLLVLIAVRGEAARRDVVRRLIYLVSRCPPQVTAAPGDDTQASLAHKCAEMLSENASSPDCQAPLLLIAAWCIGEFAAELTSDPPPLPEGPADSVIPVGPRGRARTPKELVDVLGSLLTHHKAGTEIKGVTLTALSKLLAKIPPAQLPADVVETARSHLATFQTSLNQELQARSVEFLALSSEDLADVRADILAPIPALTADAVRRLKWESSAAAEAAGGDEDVIAGLSDDVDDDEGRAGGTGLAAGMRAMEATGATADDQQANRAATKTAEAVDDEGSLLDLFGGGPSASPPADADEDLGADGGVADLFG
ncbi:ap1g1, partial [Symbiodinium sp. KB8]